MMSDSRRTFRLTWTTSAPLLRGNWVAIGLGLIPGIFSILALTAPERQGANLVAGALFFSLCTTLIQIPTFLGRIELDDESLTLVGRLSGKGGRRVIQREALEEFHFSPLRRPPRVMVPAWVMVELFCLIGAISAGLGPSSEAGSRGEHWYWLAGLVLGLSIWPMVVARWQADQVVTLTYQRPGEKAPGLIRAWATPHQASSLVNTLRGKIDWEEPTPAQDSGLAITDLDSE